MKLKYPECNVGLCASQCLEVHHIITNFGGTNDTKLLEWNIEINNVITVITELIFVKSVSLMK
jgi:hypothetical protein